MKNTLIIPGYLGSERDHWQRLWAAEDPSAHVVEQDDWENPTLSEWIYALEAELAQSPGAVLVAHSLGCILVAHLASRPSAAHIAGALLVAPADTERMLVREPKFASFAPIPRYSFNFPSVVVASRNDPYMGFTRSKTLADLWGSGFVDMGEAGHINAETGLGSWSEGQVLANSLRRDAIAAPSDRRTAQPFAREPYRPSRYATYRHALSA